MLNSCHQSPYNNIGRVIRGENNTQTKYIFNYEKNLFNLFFCIEMSFFIFMSCTNKRMYCNVFVYSLTSQRLDAIKE